MAQFNIDQTELNLIEYGLYIFGHGQLYHIVNYARLNAPTNNLALNYYMIRTNAQGKKTCGTLSILPTRPTLHSLY